MALYLNSIRKFLDGDLSRSTVAEIERECSIKVSDAKRLTKSGIIVKRALEEYIKYSDALLDVIKKECMSAESCLFAASSAFYNESYIEGEKKTVTISLPPDETAALLNSEIDAFYFYYDDKFLKSNMLKAEEKKYFCPEIEMSSKDELKNLENLEIEDLYGRVLYVPQSPNNRYIDMLVSDLTSFHKKINIKTFPYYCESIEKRVIDEQNLLLSFEPFRIREDAERKRVNWNYKVPFGVLLPT